MTGQYSRLRSHQRKRKNGKVAVYYFYDRRPEGEKDIPLGTDYDAAIRKWEDIQKNGVATNRGTLEEAFAAWEKDALPLYTSAETRRGYTKNLRALRPVFGQASWDQVDFPSLKGYLKARTAKTQGNREMSLLSIIWNWARGEGYTTLQWPAAGMERSKWKNQEKPRKMFVRDDVYAAIYEEADQTLKDCMDLASATGMRLTDCITVLLPEGDVLRLEASKTGKEAEWDLSLSTVLPELIERRRAIAADHDMLLTTKNGQPLTFQILRYRWDKARESAAKAAEAGKKPDLAQRIRALYLRDMRKRAAQKSASLEDASALLQHDDKRLTERHYGGVRKLKPVA